MKAEINNENKGKFFALYWDQMVLCSDLYGDNGLIYSITMSIKNIEEYWLQLKPLSSISDEDAIEVAKLDSSVNWNFGTFGVWKNTFGATIVSNGQGLIQKYAQTIIDISFLTPVQFDYLRLKGYALPWMGLSVDQMVEAGWIKLIGA
jgi:hypothetical protein